MPTETPTKTAKQETWQDWTPTGSPDPGPLLSREAFIARLQEIGIDASESDLRFWEYHGVLPRAVKQWSDGANRAFYPRWMIATVAQLRAFQAGGLALREIAPLLKTRVSLAIHIVTTTTELRASFTNPDADIDHEKVSKGEDRWIAQAGSQVVAEFLWADIGELARKYESLTTHRRQDHVASVEIKFWNKDGQTLDTYKMNLDNETD